MTWRLRAACRAEDPEAWSVPDDGKLTRANRRAISVCWGCPVLAECQEETAAIPPTRRAGVILAGVPYTVHGVPRVRGTPRTPPPATRHAEAA